MNLHFSFTCSASQIFHIFGEILYERNIVEQEGWQVCRFSEYPKIQPLILQNGELHLYFVFCILQNGEFYLSSFNFGNLNSHDSFEVGWHIYSWSLKQSFHFQDVFFNDVSFGNKRSNFLDSVEQGCDYCFWMIHYRSLAYALKNF